MDAPVVEVGPQGRIVIPAALRRELGLSEGTRLMVEVSEEGALVLVPPEVIDARLLAMFAVVPVSLADELIDERRREAKRQADEVW